MVNRLPSELLAEIFILVMWFSLGLRLDKVTLANRKKYSWLSVAAVCRRWREISITTPFLWSYAMFPTQKLA